MNNTKALRKYIADHPRNIYDIAHIQAQYFPLISYNTLVQSIGRLVDEGIIKQVDRGVYADAALPEADYHDAVLRYYVDNHNGMLVGDALYYELGLTTTFSNPTTLYTNRVSNGKMKHVLGYELIGADIIFDDDARKLITLLELIKNREYAISLDPVKYATVVQDICAHDYSAALFKEITTAISYEESTIKTATRLLG